MLVLSHRGRREGHAFPDNTLDAFDAALSAGCDGVETDVRRTFDGKAVLWHDRHAPDGRPILQLKHHELSRLAGYAVPTLDQALARFDGAFFDVELKSADALAAAADALGRADPTKLIVTSFRHDLVAACAQSFPFQCGIIAAHRPVRPELGPWAPFAGVSLVRTIVWELEAIDESVLAPATTQGFRHFAWGLSGAADLRAAASMNLAGAIVDR